MEHWTKQYVSTEKMENTTEQGGLTLNSDILWFDLTQVTPELLFSNLPSILQAHQLFWQEVVYPMLQEVRRTGKPFDPMRLEPGCLQVWAGGYKLNHS